MNPKEIVKTGYNNIFDKYLAWTKKIRIQERDKYESLFLELVPQNAKVLDLGCGNSVTTSLFSQKFLLTGIDISSKQIELAKKNNPDSSFILSDMISVQFDDNIFDGIVAFYSLFHLPRSEQMEMLEKVHAWLKPNGYFLATFSTLSFKDRIREDWHGTAMYWSSYTPAKINKKIRETGFKILLSDTETEIEFDEEISFLWILAQKVSQNT